MASTIDSTGFKKQRWQELRADIATKAAQNGLPDVTQNTQSIFGRVISQTTNLQDGNDSFVQALLDAFDPYAATGVQLSRLAPLMGKRRNKESKSRVMIDVTTDSNGVTLPTSFQVGDPNDNNVKFQCVSQIDIAPNSTVSVSFESTVSGSVPAKAGTLTKIVTPFFGVLSVTNPADAEEGTSQETDSQLRFRMLKTSAQSGTTSVGIYSALTQIDGVTYVSVHDIDSPLATALDIKNGEVFIIIDGGDDNDIGKVLLYRAIAAGIKTKDDVVGADTRTVTLENPANRLNQSYYFARPSDTPIQVSVTIQEDPKVPPFYQSEINTALVDYIAGLEVGAKVIGSRLYTPINTVDGFEIISVEVGLKGGAMSNELQLQPFERGSLSVDDITITVTA